MKACNDSTKKMLQILIGLASLYALYVMAGETAAYAECEQLIPPELFLMIEGYRMPTEADLLIWLHESPSRDVREAALRMIVRDATNQIHLVSALCEVVQSDDAEYIRLSAVVALGKMGKEAHPCLLALLSNDDQGVRNQVVVEFLKCGDIAKHSLLPELQRIVADPAIAYREEAAYLLEELRKRKP